MSIFGEQVLLRVYLQSADRAPHTPTYERIVQAACKERLAGATVLTGILGTGYHGVIKQSNWSLAQHVPVVVEIVDSGERIIHFVQHVLDKIMVGGMLTLERAAVMMYRKRTQGFDVLMPHLGAMIHRRCARCATELTPEYAFCPKCGLAIQAGQTEQRQGPSQPTAMQLAAKLKPLSTIPRIEPGAHM